MKINKDDIDKIIVIDWSIFLNMAAHACLNMDMYPTYTAMSMILGNLRRIGVTPDTLIILACDYGSWRKKYIPEAKADREAIRAESLIDWDKTYKDFNDLRDKLDENTDWQVCQYHLLEADDWCAGIARFYKDKEVILLSMDGDFDVLWHYDNVKLFSPHRKRKSYKIKPKNFNANKWIAKAIMIKGHNNLGVPVTEKEYDNKKMCVNLLELPEDVENTIIEKLSNLEHKDLNIEGVPFKSIRERFKNLYNEDKIMTYASCVKKEEKKLLKKKKLKGKK